MKLGSLFDGSGGFPLAGALNGITPVWASEIEPYPIRVTKARFPRMEHLGSVLDVKGDQIAPVDIITFGSPCQDLSVAGKQLGIHAGQRSNLFFEAIRIIKEMRNATSGKYPRFAVWENVPGAFSSNKGEDFRSVLEALGGISENGVSVPRPPKGKWNHAGCVVGDGWSIAWRLYDAQHWGVPQRRKRIYLVADFASERAGEILFESEGMCGNPAESGEAREGIAGHAEGGAGGSGGNAVNATGFKANQGPKARSIGWQSGLAPTLNADTPGLEPTVCYALKGNAIDRDTAQNGKPWSEEAAYTLDATDRHGVAFASGFSDSLGEKAQGGCEFISDMSPTLRSGDVSAVVYDCRGNGDGIHVPTLTGDHQNRVTDYSSVAIYDTTQITSPLNYSNPKPGDPCHPLAANQHPPLCIGNGQMCNITMQEISNSLDCMHDQQAILMQCEHPRKYIVRRLTPLECCRLQGFPDWWEQGVEGSDSARYKMWGNGIALPCAVDVLRRIKKAMEATPS